MRAFRIRTRPAAQIIRAGYVRFDAFLVFLVALFVVFVLGLGLTPSSR